MPIGHICHTQMKLLCWFSAPQCLPVFLPNAPSPWTTLIMAAHLLFLIPVFKLIRPTCLTLDEIFFCILPVAARLEGLLALKQKNVKFYGHYQSGL